MTRSLEWNQRQAAKKLVDAAIALSADQISTLASRALMFKMLGIEAKGTLLMKSQGVDSVTNLATLVILPTLLNRPAEGLRSSLEGIFKKIPGLKDDAKKHSQTTTYIQIPNITGWIGSTAYLYHAMHHGQNKQQQAERSL